MKKNKILFFGALSLLLMFFCGFLSGANVFAEDIWVDTSDYITGVYARQFNGCPSGSYPGGTTDTWGYTTCYANGTSSAIFYVSLTFGGSKCAGDKCSKDPNYWWTCNTSGGWSGSAGYQSATLWPSMKYLESDDDYDYYRVWIEPGWSGYQEIKGRIRVARDNGVNLTIKYTDTSYNNLQAQNVYSVSSGSSATGTIPATITASDGTVYRLRTGNHCFRRTYKEDGTTDAGGWVDCPTTGSYTEPSMTQNTTFWAIYEEQSYTLTIDQGAHTSITVRRGGNNLSNGAAIYAGDELVVSYGNDDCYSLTTHTVEGSTWTSGSIYTVIGDTTVVSRSSLDEYSLTKVQGEGTTVTVNRTSSPNGGASTGSLNNTAKLYCGDVLNASFGLVDGYSWGSHNFTGSGISDSTSLTINNHTVRANVVATASAEKNEFEGKVEANGEVNGWTQTSGTKTTYIDNCDPVSGCTATFKHALKRTQGSGATTYTITRESNYAATASSGTLVNSTVESFTGVSNGTGKTVKTDTVALKPGVVVCETLTFDAAVDKQGVALKMCVSTTGNAQPSGIALLNMNVKNNTVTKYGSYQNEIYAKPTDELTYRAIYHPILQYTYNLIPEKMRINGGTIYPSGSKNEVSTLENLFNAKKSGSLGNWNNAFAIDRNFSDVLNYADYEVGDTSKQTEYNNHTVGAREAGTSLNETAKTNLNNDVKTTPSQVSFTKVGGYNTGDVITAQVESVAYVRVPYNYNNTTEVTTPNTATLYAGESAEINYVINVNQKYNSYLESNYATLVSGAKRKVEVCYNGSCAETNPVTIGELNASGSLSGQQNIQQETSIVVPDAVAGSQVCVRSAVYPANSGDDGNWYDAKGSDTWEYSARVCYTVAKKPSLQVWGGNVYSNGKISTSVANKKHIALDGMSYSPNVDNYTKSYIFGSWGELGVISVGSVAGFASGAGTGYLDGGHDAIFCPNRSILTLANTCNGVSKTSGLGATGAMAGAENDKLTILARFIDIDNTPKTSSIGEVTNATGINVYYNDGNIAINGNITLAEGRYGDLMDVPKVVVYAKGNININCDVTRIDAVLIAEGEVKTCSNSDDNNARANSQQLVINGAVIANKLVANRTYGAATGINSIIPAEIINYDPTLYLWAEEQADVTESGKVRVVYTNEIAPRL